MGQQEDTICFGSCELVPAEFRLSRGGVDVPIEPQVFEVLCHLVENRHRVVPKNELLDNIWGDRFVSESALTSRIKSARQAVGDDGRTQSIIRTVHGRGYQFIAEVREAAPAAVSAVAEPSGTPRPTLAETGALIGRDTELEAVWEMTGQHRLVTILGPGGVGKTRLATEVARIWESDGNRSELVHLEPLAEPDLIAAEIADALGIRSDTEVDAFSALAESFRDDDAPLLVLDNFEHLTDGAAHVARLGTEIPHLRVLVTSRARLRLSDEHAFDLDALSLDANNGVSDAAALFEVSAQRARPDFRLTDDNAAVVGAICGVVDGVPLAIELAAAQLHYLPLDYLLNHLESNLVGIGEDLADRPSRQRSVEDLIGWSYALLTPGQQQLLARLSVFRGGWSIAGARAVGRLDSDVDAVGSLGALIDKSLVRSEPHDGFPRFGMLNLIRHFADARLDDKGLRAEVERDHTDYVVELVSRIDDDRWGPRAAHWRGDAAVAYSNISTVLERAAATGDDATLGHIVGDLNVWWYRMGRHHEGRRWTALALEAVDGLEGRTQGRVRFAAGFMAMADQRIDDARRHYLAAIELAEDADDWRYTQYARTLLTSTELTDPSRFEGASERLDDVIQQARSRGETAMLAQVLNVAGVLNHRHGRFDRSAVLLAQALDVNRELGDRYQQCMNLGNLGLLAISQAEHRDALQYCRDSLHISWRIGSQVMSAWLIAEIAHVLQLMGELRLAARLLGGADFVIESLGAHHGPTAMQSQHAETVASLRDGLGADAFAEIIDEGRRATLASTVELALGGSETD